MVARQSRTTFACFLVLALAISCFALSGGSAAKASVSDAWQLSDGGGFGAGASNAAAIPMVEFNGQLYVGVVNQGGAQLWVKNGSAWSQVTGTPDWSNDPAIVRMKVFGGKLYVGTANTDSGCGLWRFDGTTWEDVLALTGGGGRGFGDKYNLATTAIEEYGGDLYVGTTNYILDQISSFVLKTEGIHAFKLSGTADTWSSIDTSNLESQYNAGIISLAVYNGKLYASTVTFGYTYDLSQWPSISFTIVPKGCQLLRSTGGQFSVVADSGFTDTQNIAGLCMTQYGTKLFIGTANVTVTIVYNTSTGKIDGITYTSNGLSIYTYDGSGSPVELVKNGFGSNGDIAATCMEKVQTTGDERLLVGTANPDGTGKLEAYDGTTWAAEATAGFGNTKNNGILSLATAEENGNKVIYAGTLNSDQGCEVWRGEAGNPPPVVTSITPNTGTAGSTISISDLAGTGFYGTPTVKLKKSGKTITATNVSAASPTKITCKFAIPTTASTGAWDLYVQNPDGQGATKVGAFTITANMLPGSSCYLAEGSTISPFSTYISIQNPNTSAVHASITYMTTSSTVSGGTVTLPPKSQTTVNPSSKVGSKEFSTKITCREGKPIYADRTMSWTGPGASGPEAHSSVGVPTPSKTWYLPEGSSAWGFDCRVAIMNPNNSKATVRLTYMIEGSSPVTKTRTVPANRRATFSMGSDIGSHDASIKVTSNVPVVPERSMYRNNRREGHCSIGTTAPAKDYYLAEGTSAWGFTTYVLVQNPNSSATTVNVTFMTGSGPVSYPAFTMGANSRKTIRVNDTLPNKDFSTKVHGSKPVIAERSMYWNSPAGEACHDSIGLASPHKTFYLPDGQSSAGRETWTLVQNPNSTPVFVGITCMTPSGSGNKTFTATIPANSRMTFNLSDKIPNGRASILVTSQTSGKKIMVERAMYWNSRDAGTDTIGGYSD